MKSMETIRYLGSFRWIFCWTWTVDGEKNCLTSRFSGPNPKWQAVIGQGQGQAIQRNLELENNTIAMAHLHGKTHRSTWKPPWKHHQTTQELWVPYLLEQEMGQSLKLCHCHGVWHLCIDHLIIGLTCPLDAACAFFLVTGFSTMAAPTGRNVTCFNEMRWKRYASRGLKDMDFSNTKRWGNITSTKALKRADLEAWECSVTSPPTWMIPLVSKSLNPLWNPCWNPTVHVLRMFAICKWYLFSVGLSCHVVHLN